MWYVSSLYLQQVLGAVAVSRRARVPADGAHDPGRRATGGSARRALRRTRGPHVRPHDDDGRTAPARPDRHERQRDRLCRPARTARRTRDRALDRSVDDRGDAGSKTRAGRPRIGPRQHVAAGRRCHRDRAPHLTRVPAHEPSDRPEPRRPHRSHGRLPTRVPDRRRAVRGRRTRRPLPPALRRPLATTARADRHRRGDRRRRIRRGRLHRRRRPGARSAPIRRAGRTTSSRAPPFTPRRSASTRRPRRRRSRRATSSPRTSTTCRTDRSSVKAAR